MCQVRMHGYYFLYACGPVDVPVAAIYLPRVIAAVRPRALLNTLLPFMESICRSS